MHGNLLLLHSYLLYVRKIGKLQIGWLLWLFRILFVFLHIIINLRLWLQLQQLMLEAQIIIAALNLTHSPVKTLVDVFALYLLAVSLSSTVSSVFKPADYVCRIASTAFAYFLCSACHCHTIVLFLFMDFSIFTSSVYSYLISEFCSLEHLHLQNCSTRVTINDIVNQPFLLFLFFCF